MAPCHEAQQIHVTRPELAQTCFAAWTSTGPINWGRCPSAGTWHRWWGNAKMNAFPGGSRVCRLTAGLESTATEGMLSPVG